MEVCLATNRRNVQHNHNLKVNKYIILVLFIRSGYDYFRVPTFGKVRQRLWNNRQVFIIVKGKVYRAVVLSSLLCVAEASGAGQKAKCIHDETTEGHYECKVVCQTHK